MFAGCGLQTARFGPGVVVAAISSRRNPPLSARLLAKRFATNEQSRRALQLIRL